MRPLERILAKGGVADLVEVLAERLGNAELTTLMLEVYRRRVARLRPSDLFAGLAQNRFVAPAGIDPLALRRAEIAVLELARDAGFTPIELSPVAPLGASAVYGRVHQDKVLSALRGCEVVSDSSTSMVLQMTARLVREKLDHLDLVASQRNTRTSPLGPGMYAHFQLVAAASVHRSLDGEAMVALALRHLRLHEAVYRHFGLSDLALVVRRKARKAWLADAMIAALGEFRYEIADDPGSDYYEGFQIKSYAGRGEAAMELGDCGWVSWPRELSGDGHLVGFISGIGLERILLPMR
jgi:hypothetical protein